MVASLMAKKEHGVTRAHLLPLTVFASRIGDFCRQFVKQVTVLFFVQFGVDLGAAVTLF
jgi:hypothetical protein